MKKSNKKQKKKAEKKVEKSPKKSKKEVKESEVEIIEKKEKKEEETLEDSLQDETIKIEEKRLRELLHTQKKPTIVENQEETLETQISEIPRGTEARQIVDYTESRGGFYTSRGRDVYSAERTATINAPRGINVESRKGLTVGREFVGISNSGDITEYVSPGERDEGAIETNQIRAPRGTEVETFKGIQVGREFGGIRSDERDIAVSRGAEVNYETKDREDKADTKYETRRG